MGQTVLIPSGNGGYQIVRRLCGVRGRAMKRGCDAAKQLGKVLSELPLWALVVPEIAPGVSTRPGNEVIPILQSFDIRSETLDVACLGFWEGRYLVV